MKDWRRFPLLRLLAFFCMLCLFDFDIVLNPVLLAGASGNSPVQLGHLYQLGSHISHWSCCGGSLDFRWDLCRTGTRTRRQTCYLLLSLPSLRYSSPWMARQCQQTDVWPANIMAGRNNDNRLSLVEMTDMFISILHFFDNPIVQNNHWEPDEGFGDVWGADSQQALRCYLGPILQSAQVQK